MTILGRIIRRTIDRIRYHMQDAEEGSKLSFRNIINEASLGKYQVVVPDYTSPERIVPDHIPRPPYCLNADGAENAPSYPVIKSRKEIKGITESCKLAMRVLNSAENFIKVGITTDELDEYLHNLIISHGAYPSPLGYEKFPKSICTSVNNIACHGVPDYRKLIDGDIISVDVSVYLNGFHGDCAATFSVGNVDEKGRNLIEATKHSLFLAIRSCGPRQPFSVIGRQISNIAAMYDCSVVPCILGHGIGAYFHEPPDVYHSENAYGGIMEPGMTFTIEPVLCQTSSEMFLLEDGFSVGTEDDSRTAQFEHTILITDEGVEVLTTD